MRSTVMMIILVVLGLNNIDAHPYRTNVNRQQTCQQRRIVTGIHNGSLTHREVAVLRMQQSKIRNYKHMAMADGHINPAERRLLHQTQQRAGKNIYRQKHDGQRRYR